MKLVAPLIALLLMLVGQASALAAEPQCALDYDAERRALVLRYEGTHLAIDTQDEADGIRIEVDFADPVAVRIGKSLLMAAPFATWRQQGTRLVLTYKKPYNLMVEDDPDHHTAWLVNLAAPSAAELAAKPSFTLGEAPVTAIAVPAVGTPETSAAVAVAGRLPLVPVPAVEQTGPTKSEAPTETQPPTSVAVPAATPTPAPAVTAAIARPIFVGPAPKATPAAPVLTAPAGTAAPAMVEPLIAPPTSSLGGFRRGDGIAVAPAFSVSAYQESYPIGDVAVQSAGVMMPGVVLEGRGRLPMGPEWLQPDWFSAFRLDFANYAFRDTLFPLSTHTRQTWRTEVAAGRQFRWQDWRLDAGLGYMMRWESTLHSAVAPEPSYAFASGRLLHGPELTLGGGWQPTGWSWLADWGASAELTLSPAVMSRVEGGAGNLPWLVGARASVGIERWLGDHRIRLGYQRWSLNGSGYDEAFLGPFLSIH